MRIGQKSDHYKERLHALVKSMRLENWFLCIFIPFGIIFMWITPPGWNTDELDHSYRVFQLSRGNLLSEEVRAPNGLKAFGGDVPTGLVHLYNQTGVRAPGAATDKTVKLDNLYEKKPDILTVKDDGSRTPMNFSGAALYSPVAYAMYIPAFWVGKVFNLPFFHIILLARLTGLLFTALALFMAIKHIPIGKWIVFAVGLLPVVVAQAAALGADAPQLALSILFIALAMRLIFASGGPSVKEYGVITAVGLGLVLVKLVYAPLVLLLLVLPFIKQECRSKKQALLLTGSIAIAIIPGIIWTALVSYIDINSNPQADFGLQKAYILHEPIMYLKTLYYTFFTNEQFALAHIFGNFIWASAPLAAIYSYIASAALLASIFVSSGRERKLKSGDNKAKIWRLALLTVNVMIIVLIATALYVYSTTLHQSSIVGIQARYFVPILPAVLLVFYGNTVKNQRVVKLGIVIMSIIVLVGAVLMIYHRLYQTLPIILQ